MLNCLWLGMVILAVVLGGVNGKINEVTKAAIDSAAGAVTIAIGLIGAMALWLGIVKIAEDSGLMSLLAKAIAPIMKRVFPDVPVIRRWEA
jgi:spore maturation protein A